MEEGSARSTPAYLAQLRHYTLLGQKGPWAFRSHPPCPQLRTGLNISRMTLRDSINIYIIKYKLKKNSVKNTMWNKCCGFFFFFFVAVVVVVILFIDPHIPFLMNCSIFRFFRQKSRERWQCPIS